MDLPSIPSEAFAAKAREAIELHTDWDAPHAFVTLHGEDLHAGLYCAILSDVPPWQYPMLMINAVTERVAEHPDDPPVGFVLQIESFRSPGLGPDASDEDRAQFEADQENWAFDKRADSVEEAVAWCVDVHGGVWMCSQARPKPDQPPGSDLGLVEMYFKPGSPATGVDMLDSLVALATMIGMSQFGLPHPQWLDVLLAEERA